MKLNKRFLSFYYEKSYGNADYKISPEKTILLIVDMQKEFVSRDCGVALTLKEEGDWERWIPYYDRLRDVTIPAIKELLNFFREKNLPISFAQKIDMDGSIKHVDSKGSLIVGSLKPNTNEIVVSRNTDSVIAGTNYLNFLNSMGIENVVVSGITTERCVSSTIRGLYDMGYQVICVEEACASPDTELHYAELKALNIKYCYVLSTDETIRIIKDGLSCSEKASDYLLIKNS